MRTVLAACELSSDKCIYRMWDQFSRGVQAQHSQLSSFSFRIMKSEAGARTTLKKYSVHELGEARHAENMCPKSAAVCCIAELRNLNGRDAWTNTLSSTCHRTRHGDVLACVHVPGRGMMQTPPFRVSSHTAQLLFCFGN